MRYRLGSQITFQAPLAGLVDFCRRNALLVILSGFILAVFSVWYASGHLGITTDTDEMFASSLPWRQRAQMFKKQFPQFTDLLVAVIDAQEPEEADDTAAALAGRLAADHEHFLSVRRPDASPFFDKEGLLFLDTKQLESLTDRLIDAQPFLGELAKDPSARGLFGALSLLATGVEHGEVNLAPYLTALNGFHQAIADTLAGHPHPLSWVRLIGGDLADLGGRYKFVLTQPRLDLGKLEPGGVATQAIRDGAAELGFVKSGVARVRITGNVALADEEFASVTQGAVEGLVGSILLISLWLFLAVHSWRLILPILMTLGLGLMLTLLFASAAVGTLNLVSVGFGILFVGIAVDFAIQFSVRYREMRLAFPEPTRALAETGRRVGGHGGGFSRLCADGLSRGRRTRTHRRGGNADRVFLHADFLAGGDKSFPSSRRAHGSGLSLGGAARRLGPPSPKADVGRVRLAGVAGDSPPVSYWLRCRSLAHQEPAHRGDANAVRSR